jgi:hypothetical protein
VLARQRIIKTRNNKTARSARRESQRFVLIAKSGTGTIEQPIRDATAGDMTELTIVTKGARYDYYYYYYYYSGVRLNPLGTAATTGLLYQPVDAPRVARGRGSHIT